MKKALKLLIEGAGLPALGGPGKSGRLRGNGLGVIGKGL